MAELIDDLLGLARVSRAVITRQQLNLSSLAATARESPLRARARAATGKF